MKRRLIGSAVLAAAISSAPFASVFAVSAANQTAVNNGVSYLRTQQAADGHINSAFAGDSGWSAIAFAAAGVSLDGVQAPGGTSLRDFLAANPPTASSPATDWERSILAITADNQNPYNFGGVNYVENLRSKINGGQIGEPTGTNDDFFGLMALIAARTDITDAVLANEVSFILSAQHADGGFSYNTDPASGSDVDDTAAALIALQTAADAGVSNPGIASAVNNALNYIMSARNEDGGFPFDPLTPAEWGGPVSNASSTSWVIMALKSLGQDLTQDSLDAQAFVRGKQVADGSFASPYTAPGTGDVFDTAPAVTALAGGTYPLSVYAGAIPGQGQEVDPTPTPIASPTPSPSASPSVSPSPTPTPAGSVLGDATASPSPSPTPAANAVLGASTLPAVGEVSNLALILIALFVASFSGVAVRMYQIRVRS